MTKSFPNKAYFKISNNTNAAIRNESIDIKFDYKATTTVRNKKNYHFIERINDQYAKQASKYYKGFCKKINSFHDKTSTYIYVIDRQNNIESNVRCTVQTDNQKIPIEYALIKSTNESYTINENIKIAELNTFSYRNYFSISTLYEAIVRHVNEEKIKKLYALVDRRNSVTSSLYSSLGFTPSLQYHQPVFFKTYLRKDQEIPVLWDILSIETNKMPVSYPNRLL